MGASFRLALQLMISMDSPWAQAFAYSAALGVIYGVVSFPFHILSSYVVPHRYGLSTQSLDDWFMDQIKGLLVGAALGSLALAAALGCLFYLGAHWWWVLALIAALFSVVMARLAPQILIPIFFKMKPVEAPALQERMKALAARNGTPLLGLFEINMSRRTTAANAAVVGFGATRRALVGDTLLKNFTEDEVEFVLAHELAHHHYHDLWAGVATGSLALLAALLVTHLALLAWCDALGVTYPLPAGIAIAFNPALLHFMAIILTVTQALLAPLERLQSRRMEKRADEFAARTTGKPLAGAAAFERLGYQNRAVLRPPRWEEALFATHPCLARRVQRLKESAAHAHPALP